MGIDSPKMHEARVWTLTPQERKAAGLSSAEEEKTKMEVAKVGTETINIEGEEARQLQADLEQRIKEKQMGEIRSRIQGSQKENKPAEETAVVEQLPSSTPKKKGLLARIFGKK